jgi:broad specificity phosphatase PhoE
VKQVYLVRHALTEMNVAGKFSGTVDTKLTDEGIAQAQQTGKEIKKAGIMFDLIICSPLSRTYDTAKQIATAIDYPIEDIKKDDLLIERNFGELEGTYGKDFWSNHNFSDLDKVNGAETTDQLGKRAKRILLEIDRLKANNILLVTHGAIGRALRREVKNIPHHYENDDKHRTELQIPNAGLIRLI